MNYTYESTQAKNTRLLDAFMAKSGSDKQAEALDGTNSYIRTKIMEDAVTTNIIPVETVGNEDLTVWLDTKYPAMIVEKEPEATGAVSVQFGTQPDTNILEGQRIPIYFNKRITDEYVKDTDELRVWRQDIRQIICDQQVKWLAFLLDRCWLTAYQQALKVQLQVGLPQLAKAYTNGLTKENFVDSLEIMLTTRNHLRPTQMLCHETTLFEFFKWGRDQMGGDMAQEMFMSGQLDKDFMGQKIHATIKHELIPKGYIYQFADAQFLGKNYLLQPTTMVVETKGTKISWYMYESRGGCIVNAAAVALACFNPGGISEDGYTMQFNEATSA